MFYGKFSCKRWCKILKINRILLLENWQQSLTILANDFDFSLYVFLSLFVYNCKTQSMRLTGHFLTPFVMWLWLSHFPSGIFDSLKLWSSNEQVLNPFTSWLTLIFNISLRLPFSQVMWSLEWKILKEWIGWLRFSKLIWYICRKKKEI